MFDSLRKTICAPCCEFCRDLCDPGYKKTDENTQTEGLKEKKSRKKEKISDKKAEEKKNIKKDSEQGKKLAQNKNAPKPQYLAKPTNVPEKQDKPKVSPEIRKKSEASLASNESAEETSAQRKKREQSMEKKRKKAEKAQRKAAISKIKNKKIQEFERRFSNIQLDTVPAQDSKSFTTSADTTIPLNTDPSLVSLRQPEGRKSTEGRKVTPFRIVRPGMGAAAHPAPQAIQQHGAPQAIQRAPQATQQHSAPQSTLQHGDPQAIQQHGAPFAGNWVPGMEVHGTGIERVKKKSLKNRKVTPFRFPRPGLGAASKPTSQSKKKQSSVDIDASMYSLKDLLAQSLESEGDDDFDDDDEDEDDDDDS